MYEKLISHLITTWKINPIWKDNNSHNSNGDSDFSHHTLIIVFWIIRLIKENRHTPTSIQARSGSALIFLMPCNLETRGPIRPCRVKLEIHTL
ncbi:hypothetical protein BpHYR1_028488 [Brachionus plicatilis]|uniref:Uncharacterized protein n=1 Tax=Brachionus plicatilis TaxID=10195 RepID=A0A3M7R327_BRAPC|nr:hypothetical protein BpHYR1_028488 [Brachionus plicatilis]